MTRSALAAWILSLPLVNGNPRPVEVVFAIADVTLATSGAWARTSSEFFGELFDPDGSASAAVKRTASRLDTFAALESGYRVEAAGDCPGMAPGSLACSRARGARSCGLLQTPCGITPRDARGQVELAERLFEVSAAACPAYPLSPYARGACVPWRNGEWRERIIARAMRSPWLGEAERDHDGTPEVFDVQ